MANSEMEMQEVEAGGWAKMTKAGEVIEGVFSEYFIKPATENFGEQIVAVLHTDAWITNVAFPSKNPRYHNSVKALKVGHRVRVTLTGFYNQETSTVVSEPGKTKKGISFSKNYSIQQSKTPDPSFMEELANKPAPIQEGIDVNDLPF